MSHDVRPDIRLPDRRDIWPPFEWKAIDDRSEQHVLQRWQSHSVWFSGLDITRPTDRLLAFAGLARLFNELYLGDVYAAGFFLQQLPAALLWKVYYVRDRVHGHDQDYVAPTWSWLSVKGAIEFREYGTISARVDSYSRTLVDDTNPYSMLLDASLLVEGWIFQLDLPTWTLSHDNQLWTTNYILDDGGESFQTRIKVTLDKSVDL